MKNVILVSIISLIFFTSCESSGKLTDYVNPLLGSATLWDKKDLGYERHKKVELGERKLILGQLYLMRWFR